MQFKKPFNLDLCFIAFSVFSKKRIDFSSNVSVVQSTSVTWKLVERTQNISVRFRVRTEDFLLLDGWDGRHFQITLYIVQS